MSRHEQSPTDAELRRDLHAIDEALAGNAVSGPGAPVAELALALSSLREEPGAQFVRSLDARAAAGFRGERRARPLASSLLPRLRRAALRPAAAGAAAPP